MATINLSKRLTEIYNLVSKKRVCDVACDHGKVIAKLFQNNQIDYAIVSDISEKCALKAKNLLEKLNHKNFEMRVGDGFENIYKDDNIQEAIISGLGGLEIIKIFQNLKFEIESFIIQPQNNNILLKKYLISNGYNIITDKIILDDKYYNIIKIEKGEWVGDEFDLYFGKDNFKNNDNFKIYLNYLENKINKFINKLFGEKLSEYTKLKRYIEIAKIKLGVKE